MARPHILVIEDVASVAMTYAAYLEESGYQTTVVSTGAAAITELENSLRRSQAGGSHEGEGIAAIMLDLNLPDTDGLTLYTSNLSVFGRLPVIVATADGTLPRASEAVRKGAFDYLIKPISPDRLNKTLEKALAGAAAQVPGFESPQARPEKVEVPVTERSDAMREMRRDAMSAARTKAPALVFGEHGTGRRQCADWIHRQSGRAASRFIVVNCRDRAAAMLEEEIFGVVAGAKPGVVTNRIGALHLATGGTVFFDGLDSAPAEVQVRLLEFIETGMVKRVGSLREEPVDARVIGGTNQDILDAAEEGRFNRSLCYALAGYPVYVPALRERREDILALANQFIERDRSLGAELEVSIDASMLEGWSEYDWPGNLEELSTVVRQMASAIQSSQANGGLGQEKGHLAYGS